MAEQNKNAANKGDQLKHCLLAEVLQRCAQWPELAYSETHGGAGIYSGEGQALPHIATLRDQVVDLQPGELLGPGARYAELLRDWWKASSNALLYPGSVKQAGIQLSGRKDMHFRVTEACPDTHRELVGVMRTFGSEPRLGGFQENVQWLTTGDWLVLLIDPFTYSADPNGLMEGKIDLHSLEELVDQCWGKAGCAIGFWCSMGRLQPEGQQFKLEFTATLRERTETQRASFRWFEYGNYSISWIGIGKGKTVIDGIPPRKEWKQSWLKNVIKETE